MSAETPDIGQFSGEIVIDLTEELAMRFPGLGTLPERERDAILAALGKAAWLGMLRGIAVTADEFNRKVREIEEADPTAEVTYLEPVLKLDTPVPDTWLTKYGEDT